MHETLQAALMVEELSDAEPLGWCGGKQIPQGAFSLQHPPAHLQLCNTQRRYISLWDVRGKKPWQGVFMWIWKTVAANTWASSLFWQQLKRDCLEKLTVKLHKPQSALSCGLRERLALEQAGRVWGINGIFTSRAWDTYILEQLTKTRYVRYQPAAFFFPWSCGGSKGLQNKAGKHGEYWFTSSWAVLPFTATHLCYQHIFMAHLQNSHVFSNYLWSYGSSCTAPSCFLALSCFEGRGK